MYQLKFLLKSLNYQEVLYFIIDLQYLSRIYNQIFLIINLLLKIHQEASWFHINVKIKYF